LRRSLRLKQSRKMTRSVIPEMQSIIRDPGRIIIMIIILWIPAFAGMTRAWIAALAIDKLVFS
jgi:hypothetical protein